MKSYKKQDLATEYSILKKAVWSMDGVCIANNDQKAHYNRAMAYYSTSDLINENDRLFKKLVAAI